MIGKELNVLTMGFYSIIEMASAMPDIFRTERPFPNGDWLLFLAATNQVILDDWHMFLICI